MIVCMWGGGTRHTVSSYTEDNSTHESTAEPNDTCTIVDEKNPGVLTRYEAGLTHAASQNAYTRAKDLRVESPC